MIHAALESLPAGPGVYRMATAKGDVLYIGKAKSLRKWVATDASAARLSTRLQRMVAQNSVRFAPFGGHQHPGCVLPARSVAVCLRRSCSSRP